MNVEKDKQEILRRLVRDLATCSYHEMQVRWQGPERAAVEMILSEAADRPISWVNVVPETHNPFFYVAEKCWFDNKAGDPRYLWPPYHRDALCSRAFSYLTDPKPKTAGDLFEGPRDTFKSTFTHGVIPMTMLLRDKHLFNKDSRVILRHHKEEMASANLVRMRDKFRFHPWVRKYWDDACPITYGDKGFGNQTQFDLRWCEPSYLAEKQVRAIGLTGSDTGFHSDYDFGDDLVTEDHMTSKKIRDDARLRYEAKQFTRDTLEGKEFNTGTRYHLNDLWKWMEDAKLENGEPMYKVTRIPAIWDDDTLSLPHRLTREFLDRRLVEIRSRYGSDILWYLQYQNDPRTAGLTIAHPSWFKFCKRYDISPKSWRIITVDAAWKGTKNAGEGDYAAIEVWALERRGSLILRTLLDGAYSNEFTALDGCNQIFRLMNKWGVFDVAPEEHGGYAFRTMLETEATTRGLFINILELQSKQTSKQMRMSTFLKEMQAGRVFINEDCDPVTKNAFKQQVLDFPQCVEDECDALDAAAYTMDPEVLESYAPTFFAPEVNLSQQPSAGARLTRHCAA